MKINYFDYIVLLKRIFQLHNRLFWWTNGSYFTVNYPCNDYLVTHAIEVMRSHDNYRLECMNCIKNLCHVRIISGLLSDMEDGQCLLTGKSFMYD